MGDSLSLDDLVWRREPVGPDLDYDEIAALSEKVVGLRRLSMGHGRHFAPLIEPTKLRTAMWEEQFKDARQRWEDAIHRRFYNRGKPDEVKKLDAEAPRGGFSMWPKRKRRQQEIAYLWVKSLAIDFDAWAEHVEDIARRPIASLHDRLWAIYGELQPLSVHLDLRRRTGLQSAEAEMWNIMEVWQEVSGVDSSVSVTDELAAAILSQTASESLSLDRLSELLAGAQRADIPALLTLARGVET